MTTTLYYYSGTGNSLSVARDLAAKIEDCELISIANLRRASAIMAESEAVGFVFPLYFAGVPHIVADFVKRINLEKVNYLFTVVTFGGSPSYALTQFEALLQAKSKTLNAAFHLQMPSNYIIAFYYIYSEAFQQKLFARAGQRLEIIAQVVKDRKTQVERNSVIVETVARLAAKLWARVNIPAIDRQYLADAKCLGCGTCVQICPAQNITLIAGKPKWLHRCERCMACLQFCPVEAIQCGVKTVKKHRYHHPAVAVKDMIVTL
jgi:ferredoxin